MTRKKSAKFKRCLGAARIFMHAHRKQKQFGGFGVRFVAAQADYGSLDVNGANTMAEEEAPSSLHQRMVVSLPVCV